MLMVNSDLGRGGYENFIILLSGAGGRCGGKTAAPVRDHFWWTSRGSIQDCSNIWVCVCKCFIVVNESNSVKTALMAVFTLPVAPAALEATIAVLQVYYISLNVMQYLIG